ncbi:hypothetical protein Tco_0837741, partial [Tanacetum coccineum]
MEKTLFLFDEIGSVGGESESFGGGDDVSDVVDPVQ